MRGLLVFNPHATTTDEPLRDLIAAALASIVDLEVVPTEDRGHATELTAKGVEDGVDVVFSLGGDGTANEVLQSVAGTDVRLGVIPGGGTNVLARALGLPNDPVRATNRMLTYLSQGVERRIGLGLANDRYFSFGAGFGFDAALIRSVERHPRLKRSLRQGSFVLLGLSTFARGGAERHEPAIEVAIDDTDPVGPYWLAVASNSDPFTYLGPRPLRLTPGASLDDDLDLMALEVASTARVLRLLAGAFSGGRHVEHPSVHHWRGVREARFTASRPQPLQVDGDDVGDAEHVHIRSIPAALRVLARPPEPSEQA